MLQFIISLLLNVRDKKGGFCVNLFLRFSDKLVRY